MALTYRFYRSPQIGTGTKDDPLRSKLTLYIFNDGSGSRFWDWVHYARPVRYALAHCESSTHTQIAADPEMTPLSGELADRAAIDAWMAETLQGAPQSIRDLFEADGFSVSWATTQTTKKQMLRYLCKVHVQTQDLERLGQTTTLECFRRALDSQVNQLPANVRTGVRDWMQAKGLDTTWIGGTTTIRQVIQYIVENIDWPVLTLGDVEV